MDLLHHPLLLDAAKTPQLRVALSRIRHKSKRLLSRLTPRPAAQLVLIGPPGTGKRTLSDQIILIEAIEPVLQRNRALQCAAIFISKSIRFAARKLNPSQGSWAENTARIGLKEIQSSVDEPLNAQAINVPADRWNFVSAEKGFANI
jgi:hypothetical protein